MEHILMDGTPTFWLDGHIGALGRLLHKFFKAFLHILALWWVIWREFISRKICGGEINHCVLNFKVFIELS